MNFGTFYDTLLDGHGFTIEVKDACSDGIGYNWRKLDEWGKMDYTIDYENVIKWDGLYNIPICSIGANRQGKVVIQLDVYADKLSTEPIDYN